VANPYVATKVLPKWNRTYEIETTAPPMSGPSAAGHRRKPRAAKIKSVATRDALAGIRYWHVGENLQFTTNTLNFSRSQNWVDPLVGGRITGNLSDKIDVAIAGDVGGWGTGSQLDYQVGGFLGYRIKPNVALQAGYRYLSVDYTNGNKQLNLNISGPLFGVTINLK
jgi:opacity protein-like surface antigen